MSTAPKYPPIPGFIVESSRRATREFAMFLQSLLDQAAAAGSGLVASVSGTSPITSSGGTTPAIGLANSGVSAGSYTNANFTVSAKGLITAASNGTLRTFAVPLNNTQIKALPTTRFPLVAAPGVGFRNRLLAYGLHGAFTSGAYTNINTTYASCQVETTDGQWVTGTISNDGGLAVPLTTLSDFFGAASDMIVDFPVPFLESNGPDAGGLYYVQPYVLVAGFNDNALLLGFDNNGSGNLTGGNAANSLLASGYYAVEAL